MSSPFDMQGFEKLLGSLADSVNTMREDASHMEVEGSAGGGAVSVRANGNLELLAVRISPEAMDVREMLEDLVVVAVNDALRRVQEGLAGQMGALTAGLPLPPGIR